MSEDGKNEPPDRRRGEEKADSANAETLKVRQEVLASSGRVDPPARTFGPRDWFFAAALVAAVFAAYQPAWQGGFVWDDDAHVTRPALRSWHGLYRIWFDLGATQQYYPLLHSAFWLQYKLWGATTLGYHLVNIFLHAAAALMVAMILRRLAIPGAYLAAAIFALHPLQVESVAWITELKNTLSGVFYLGAMLSYLRFDHTRGRSWYALTLLLFLLGLLSKTVTATLPAALWVIIWWKRGRLSWKTDVLPLLPFLVLGAAGGLLTAWVERKLIGAEGDAFTLTLVQRGLIAGRAIWFYLGKLFWPVDLIFIYPRWQVSQCAWQQWLFTLAAAALLLALWTLRGRSRGLLAAALFFIGTLFPALGFLNVYPFLYSFVADHFQYLASLGIITLFSAGAALLLKRVGGWGKVMGDVGCVALLAVLAVLSWRQSGMYSDIAILWRNTIDRNPDCWLAHCNLGVALADRGRVDEAVIHFQKALEIKPDNAEAHCNLGVALADRGQVDEAIAHYRKALEIKPQYAEAHYNFALALTGRGQVDEAIAHYREALEIKPDYEWARDNLGAALAARGQFDEAIAQFRKVLEITPEFVAAHQNLEIARSERERVLRGLAQRRALLRLCPTDATLLNDTAWLLATNPNASIRDGAEAVILACRAAELSGSKTPEILGTLAAAYAEAGRFAEAAATARKVAELATQQNKPALAEATRARLRLYEAGKAYRESW